MTTLSPDKIRHLYRIIEAKEQALRAIMSPKARDEIRAEIRAIRDQLKAHDKALPTAAQRREAEAEATRRIEQQVRSAGPGCTIETRFYGPVQVVRINQKSVTIETSSGHRERIPFALVGRVVEVGT